MRHRYVQDSQTGELIPIERRPPAPPRAPMVIGDIKPYRSIIDGRVITSRSKHREHLAAHGCREVGNEAPAWLRERHYEAKHGRQTFDQAAPAPAELPPEAAHIDALAGLDLG